MDDEDIDLLLALADEAEEAPARGVRISVGAKGQAEQTHTPRPSALDSKAAAAASVSAYNQTSHRVAHTPAPPSTARPSAQHVSRPQQPSRQVVDGYTDRISGFRVSKPVIGSLVLKERLTDDCVYISLKDISPSGDHAGRWATMAALVSKTQATSRDGSSYSRWTLSDLAGKQVTLFLWRKAASEHFKELEGSLLLLWSPQVRRDEGGSSGGGAGYSLHIDKPEMLQRPGMSADFGLCRGIRKDGQRCTNPVNKSTCEYCPYHAQAALRALSSNRSDMAGANLLQRQLLPQARAAQKQLSATTGKPLGGINSLIARPPPPKLLPGSAVTATMGSARVGAGLLRAADSASGIIAAAAAGTGAYGVSGGGSDGNVGGKRSYGAQLLANLQERQTALEDGGGPAAKRRRASVDACDVKPSAFVSAAKARAITAALAAGQMAKQPGGAAAAHHTPPPAAAPPAGAAVQGSGGSAARRPPSLSGPRLSMPPPLPPHLASLLKPHGANGGAKTPETQAAGVLKALATESKGRNLQRPGCSSNAAADSGERGIGRESAIEVMGNDDEGGEEELVIVDYEDDPACAGETLTEPAADNSGQPCSDAGPGHTRSSSAPASGLGQDGKETGLEDDKNGLTFAEIEQRQQKQDLVDAPGNAAGLLGPSEPAKAGAAGSGGEQAVDGEGCGLDELLELFPKLQDADVEKTGEEEQEADQPPDGATGADGTYPCQQERQSTMTVQLTFSSSGASDNASAGFGGGGSGGGGVRVGTGTLPAVAAGLLPQVPGLAIAPSARAAEARKQQAAAAKSRAEKLKSLGLKVPPAKPLGVANTPAGGRPQASGAAAAATLAGAKGLTMPRAAPRNAAAQAAAAAAAAAVGTNTATAGPLSALAAAFGNLVQQLPETTVGSRYSELSEDAAGEAVMSMLEGLEARDALVQQLDSITHLKVTAWHCAECNRLSEFLDKQCRAEGHTLSKTSTLKRFWTCDHCNARITTLGVRFPANRCSRCNNPSLEFTACTMYRGPRELKPAGMASATGLASKENLFATIEQHPEIGRRTFR